jgi:MFS family permease
LSNSRILHDFYGISRGSKLLIIGSFFGNLAMGTIFTDLSYFLHTVRGISIIYAGLVFTIEGISASSLAIPFGMISDRKGRKMMIIYGNIILGFSVIFIALSTTPLLLFLAAIIIGISDAAYTSSQGAMLSEISTNEKRTASFSLNSLASNGAWAGRGFILYLISPLSAIGITELDVHLILYFALGIATIGSTLFLLRIKEIKQESRNENHAIMDRGSWHIIGKYVISNLGIAVGAGLFVPLMTQWFNYKYISKKAPTFREEMNCEKFIDINCLV